MERVGDVHIAEVRLDGGVRGSKLQVNHDAVDEGDGAVDERVVPDLGLAHLDGDGRDFGAHEGGFLRFRYEVSDTSTIGEVRRKSRDFGSRVVRLTLADDRAKPSQPLRTRGLTYDTAGLAGVDFEGVGLEKFGEALNVWEAEVGIAP